MPRRDDLHKILILGSGPIVIGQAAEFDYSGVQACKVLREEGYEIVLVNSNPATIMTDPEFADATYIEPLLPGPVAPGHRARAPRRAAAHARRPDRAEPGQGAARGRDPGALRGRAHRRRLRRHRPRRGPRPLPPDDGARRAADARAARSPPRSAQALAALERHRAAGDRAPGLHPRRPRRRHRPQRGGVPARSSRAALAASPIGQVLHRPVGARLGRVRARGHARPARQRRDRLLDREHRPDGRAHRRLGHRGAPQQTLTDRLYQRLRDQAIAVIRAVGVETGGSNVQFAVNPETEEILVIEMNPRVSRSIGAGLQGHRLPDRQDRRAPGRRLRAGGDLQRHHRRSRPRASSPRSTTWSSSGRASPSRSSPGVGSDLSTHMKSVGEAMAIGRTFEQAFGKALRSRELDIVAALDGSTRRRCWSMLERPPVRSLRRRCWRPSAGRERRRGPRAHADRPLVPAGAARAGARPRGAVRRRALVQVRRHLRRRVPGRDAVLLLGLGAPGRPRGRALRGARASSSSAPGPTASARASSSTTAASTRR